MITETDYPLLAWTGYALGEKPESIPIVAFDKRGVKYMATNEVFRHFMTLFESDRYQGTTLKEKMRKLIPRPVDLYLGRNLYITPKVGQELDRDETLRATLWKSLRNLPTVSGTMLWKVEEGTLITHSQHTYRVLSLEDTRTFALISHIKRRDLVPNARLMIVAYFAGDWLTAFEFGFLTAEGQLHVCWDSSYYADSDTDAGQYLTDTSITLLAWLQGRYVEKTLEPGVGINQSRQPIIILSHQ